jgi:predicted phosphodiesterase
MKEPVLILSDLHLGHKASSLDDIAALAPLLQGAGTLILNGDTWQELALEFRDDGARMWRELQELCGKMDIDLICLPGNHDPGNGQENHVALAQGKIIITHGDAVFPEVAPWSRVAILKEKEIRRMIEASAPDSLDARFALAREVSRMLVPPYYAHSKNILARVWDAVTPPGRAWRMLLAWATMVRRTCAFRERYFPVCEIIICGHFHRAGIWETGETLVINSGSFMPPGAAYWCEWSEGRLRVGVVKKRNGYWRRAEILGVWNLP